MGKNNDIFVFSVYSISLGLIVSIVGYYISLVIKNEVIDSLILLVNIVLWVVIMGGIYVEIRKKSG